MQIRSVVIGLVAFSVSATGAVIQNFSFEIPDLGHNTSTTQRFTAVDPLGWTSTTQSSQVAGVLDPSNNEMTGTDGATLPGTAQGAQYGYLNLAAGDMAYFTYSGPSLGTFGSGDRFTLTVAIGSRRDGGLPPDMYVLALLSGTSVIATVSGTPTSDTFKDIVLNYSDVAADVGKTIGIRLTALNQSTHFEQAAFDNVRMDVVPEPGTAGFLLLALSSLVIYRKHASAR